MNRIYSVLAIFIIAMSSLLAAPKLEIEGGTTYDWGRVKPEDSPLKAKIKLWNRGDEVLHIKNVKPGCGCTTAPLDTNMIDPGKYATLEVSLNISSYNGPVTKSISVFSNDSSKDHAVLLIKADVTRPIASFPTYIAFSKLFVGEEGNTKVVLTNNTDKPITITNITSSDTRLKFNLKAGDVLPPKQPVSLDANIKPDKTGRLDFNVKIETDSDEAKTLEVRGWGNIVEMPTTNK